MLHARRADDVLFEHLVDDAPCGFDVEQVQLGIYVFRHRAGDARPVENGLDMGLVLHVARIDHGRAQAGFRDALRIEKRGFALAVIRAARKQDEVGLCFLKVH